MAASQRMISLVIQDLREANKFIDIECEVDSSVEDIKCLINIELQVEVEKQELYFRQLMLMNDSAKLNAIGINHGDMINMAISQLDTQDQDLMNNFFAKSGSAGKRARFTQQQLSNQMIHNAQRMRIRQEVSKVKEMWLTDQHFKTRLQSSDQTLAEALASDDDRKLEKIVTDRLKEVMDKQKAEQERQVRLRNADPNDQEAQ